MKYVLLFCGTLADQAAFESMKPEELRQRYAEVGRWFADNRARLGHGNQLQGPETATTVRFQPNGTPIVKDGLFLEGKELVGGYTEVEVRISTKRSHWPRAGLDAARSRSDLSSSAASNS